MRLWAFTYERPDRPLESRFQCDVYEYPLEMLDDDVLADTAHQAAVKMPGAVLVDIKKQPIAGD